MKTYILTKILLILKILFILSKINSFNQKQRKFRIPYSAYSAFPISCATQPSIFFVSLEKFTPMPTTGLPGVQVLRQSPNLLSGTYWLRAPCAITKKQPLLSFF